MQVLEMEEVESLVGSVNRRKLKFGEKTTKSTSTDGKLKAIAACFQRGDLLSKIVVFACVLLLVIMYSTTQNGEEVHTGGDVKVKTPPAAPTVPKAIFPSDVDVDVDITVAVDNGKDNGKDKDKEATPPPTKAPVPPPTTPPTLPPKIVAPDGNTDPYLYSKYATVQPLIDHPLPSDEEKERLKEKYGKWGFWDGDEEERPMEDYAGRWPNRDILGEAFPDDAWQADAVYVNHVLNDMDKLIGRAKEAIFVEYGHGKPLPPEGALCSVLLWCSVV